MYINYFIWAGFTLYVEAVFFMQSVRILLWAICYVLESPDFRDLFQKVSLCCRNVCVFIANSFVIIHPVFYTANHYDMDAFVPPYNSVGVGVGVGGGGARTIASVPFRQRPTEITIEFVVLPWTQYKANEQWHIVKDQTSPGRWHIGLVIEVVDSSNEIAFCVDVLADASSFFRFPMQNAKSYLIEMAEEEPDAVILAADLEHNIRTSGLYDLPDAPLLIKTHWIRIIQRVWKRIYAERMRLALFRGSLMAQRRFELTGKYGIPVGERLKGMLCRRGRKTDYLSRVSKYNS
jgi:hypothetical protein